MSTPKGYIMTPHHKLMRSTSARGSEEELSISAVYIYTTITYQGGSVAQQLHNRESRVHSQQHEPHLLKSLYKSWFSEICHVNVLDILWVQRP